MADSASAAAGGFGWDTLSSMSNVVGVLVIGPAILILQWVFKKQAAKKSEKKEKNRQQILDIVTEVNKPLNTKMESIDQSLNKYTEQGEAIIENLEKLVDKVDILQSNQAGMQTKVEFMDKFFQNNLQLKHDEPDDDHFNRDSFTKESTKTRKRGREGFK